MAWKKAGGMRREDNTQEKNDDGDDDDNDDGDDDDEDEWRWRWRWMIADTSQMSYIQYIYIFIKTQEWCTGGTFRTWYLGYGTVVRYGGTVWWYAWYRFKGTGGTRHKVHMVHYKTRSVPKKKHNQFEKNTTQSIELVVFFSKLVVFFFGTGVWVRSYHMTVPYRTLIP